MHQGTVVGHGAIGWLRSELCMGLCDQAIAERLRRLPLVDGMAWRDVRKAYIVLLGLRAPFNDGILAGQGQYTAPCALANAMFSAMWMR